VGPTDFQQVRRVHAADTVFEQLAASILRGDFAPGGALPPERVLGEQFGVSRIIVRQAVHRLADMGLVRSRAGGSTIVLDPAEARDPRVVELWYRLERPSARDVRDFVERQIFEGYVVVHIAALRAPRARLEAIAALVDDFLARGAPEAELLPLETAFWTSLAEAGGNRLYVFEVRWWYRLLAEQPRAHRRLSSTALVRASFLRDLARRLVEGADAPRFYLEQTLPTITGAASPGVSAQPARANARRTPRRNRP
jgi:DNA-binding FadR family transcriptional regulator